jgi:hypothetical protein
MVKAEHRPDCKGYAIGREDDGPRPRCPGCVSDADRVLWRRLADETAAYLRRPQ